MVSGAPSSLLLLFHPSATYISVSENFSYTNVTPISCSFRSSLKGSAPGTLERIFGLTP